MELLSNIFLVYATQTFAQIDDGEYRWAALCVTRRIEFLNVIFSRWMVCPGIRGMLLGWTGVVKFDIGWVIKFHIILLVNKYRRIDSLMVSSLKVLNVPFYKKLYTRIFCLVFLF